MCVGGGDNRPFVEELSKPEVPSQQLALCTGNLGWRIVCCVCVCVLEGCRSLCQPVSVPLYKAPWTDGMSYGADVLVTAVALKHTAVAEAALPDSHRYSSPPLLPPPLFLWVLRDRKSVV